MRRQQVSLLLQSQVVAAMEVVTPCVNCAAVGNPDRSRTCRLCWESTAVFSKPTGPYTEKSFIIWCARRDSNPRPTGSKVVGFLSSKDAGVYYQLLRNALGQQRRPWTVLDERGCYQGCYQIRRSEGKSAASTGLRVPAPQPSKKPRIGSRISRPFCAGSDRALCPSKNTRFWKPRCKSNSERGLHSFHS